MSIRQATTSSLALILACAMVWTWPASLAAAAAPRIGLTVRVYKTTGLPSALQERAQAEAETVLREALVDVHWEECTGMNSAPACHLPPGPSEVVLAVREGTACVKTSVTLGEAFVVPRASGVLATVYVNCIARLATESGTDVGVLLGRVAAHELGHLMMRSAAHARRGLMRPKWTPSEVRQNRAADWTFTAADIAAMHQPSSNATTRLR